jgi:hypothetical protein
MRIWLTGILVVAVSAALGFGAAYGSAESVKSYRTQNAGTFQPVPAFIQGRMDEGMRPGARRFVGQREKIRDRLEQFRNRKSGGENPEP